MRSVEKMLLEREKSMKKLCFTVLMEFPEIYRPGVTVVTGSDG